MSASFTDPIPALVQARAPYGARVLLHGGLREVEPLGYLRVGESLRGEPQDLLVARPEDEIRVRAAPLLEPRTEQIAGQHRLALERQQGCKGQHKQRRQGHDH